MTNKNKLTVENLDTEIKILQDLKSNLIGFLNFDCTNVEEEILKRYITLQNTSNVAKSINDDGYKIVSINSSKKYDSTSIKAIINNKDINVNSDLQAFAKKIFDANKKSVNKRYN